MSADDLVMITREGLALLVLLSLPPIGAALVVGIMVALVQTATQVQEQTIGFAFRAAAVIAALLVAAPWMGAQLVTFTELVLATIGGGGVLR